MWKLKPNLKIRPVILWPSLIILLATSITFYILKQKEESLRIKTQKQLAKTVLEKKAFENELTITLRKKEILQNQLVSEKERSLALEKEVEEKKRQIGLVLDKLEKEMSARREAEVQLIIAMQEKRILGTRLKEFIEVPRTIELEKVVVKAAPVLAGKVVKVDEECAFIVVNLGRVDKLMLGDILSVYRGSEFIGRVQVEKIEEKVSAAAILPEWQDVEFKMNDEVRQI